jgi:hypothetical protein
MGTGSMVRLLETCFRIKNDTYYLKCSVCELRTALNWITFIRQVLAWPNPPCVVSVASAACLDPHVTLFQKKPSNGGVTCIYIYT